jgi:hypothetical protein
VASTPSVMKVSLHSANSMLKLTCYKFLLGGFRYEMQVGMVEFHDDDDDG